MANNEIHSERIIQSWILSSDEDYEIMTELFNSKRYSWALFLGHLTIEKLLKAYYVKIYNDHSPYVHSLVRLSELVKLNLDADRKIDFITISTFNINGRYDDYKFEFHKKCTKEFAGIWIEKIKIHRTWIKELLQ